jgi:two-component system nitrate/nitrite response regulator NarL
VEVLSHERRLPSLRKAGGNGTNSSVEDTPEYTRKIQGRGGYTSGGLSLRSASNGDAVRTSPASARVLVVDTHQLFAEVLRAALRRAGWFDVTVATRLEETLERVRTLRPHILLLDTGLLEKGGLDLGQAILADLEGCRVVAMLSVDHQLTPWTRVRGFDAYTSKDISITNLTKTLRAALNDEVGGRVIRGPGTQSEAQGDEFLLRQLTPREREVLSLLCDGIASQGLADRLKITRNTVRAHVHNLLSKLQVNSRLEAVALAARIGFARRPPSHAGGYRSSISVPDGA